MQFVGFSRLQIARLISSSLVLGVKVGFLICKLLGWGWIFNF